MGKILIGNIRGPQGEQGEIGKSAYQYAQEGGYKETETEFAEDMNPYNIKAEVTPEVGVDYFTENDKNIIVSRVYELIKNNGVVGIIDKNNNIVLTGNLSDGTYSVKYEMDDGSTVNIGNLVLYTNVYYSVTKNLTNCTISNSATSVIKGESYSATISADDGYELSSVVVTMGGANVTVSNGVINITNVTGDIVITAQAAKPVTVSIGLRNGIRLGSDGSDRTGATGYCATDRIDLSNIPKPCIINLTKAKWTYATASETGYIMTCARNSGGTNLVVGATNDTIGSGYFTVVRNNGKNIDVTVTVTSDAVTEICFSGNWSNAEVTAEYPEATTTMLAEATLTYTPK